MSYNTSTYIGIRKIDIERAVQHKTREQEVIQNKLHYMTYHMVFDESNTVGATCRVGTTYPSGEH